MLDDILLQVNRPARYIGEEWNISRKKFDRSYIKFALCFPDLYEIGMSNLGFRIIYGILNSIEDTCCERFFSCNCDLENILINKSLEIFSLESKKTLGEFDMIGFSLCSELNYTNVLNILKLGRIPVEASLRNHSHPLVIGGGPCTLNPEPLHEFFDFFVIGEAEDIILDIVNSYRKYKDQYRSSKITKQQLLYIFSQIQGIYAPSLYEVEYNSKNGIENFKPRLPGLSSKIKKRFVKDFNCAFFPKLWLVPYTQIVHDRISLEIMRGCPNRCRFCQARVQYYPFREKSLDNLLNLAEETQGYSGYEEISLAGLSISDYSKIEELIKHLVEMFKTKAVSLSLPSLKAKSYVENLSCLVAAIKKTGLTFAPEAGSQRLRNILAKDFDEEIFFKAIEKAYYAGYQHVKLYFMIGLPFEEFSDLDAIIDFSLRVSELKKRITRTAAQLNLSINSLIPRPHTPFQWFSMEHVANLEAKQNYLKNKIKNKKFRLSFHNPAMSFLEAALSRGDRRLSQVILGAFNRGAKFDAWDDHFRLNIWLDAFRESEIDPYFYLRKRPIKEFLPWDFIDVGISKDALAEEFNKTIEIH